LFDLPFLVWSRLALVTCGLVPNPGELRSLCLRAVATFGSLVKARIWIKFETLPLCLAVGDVTENVLQLLEGPKPEEPVAAKIWRLGRTGRRSVEFLINAVLCFLQLAFSALISEQAHAAVSMMRKYHKEYSALTLLTRAFVYTLARFLPMSSDKKMAAIDKKGGQARETGVQEG